MNRGLLALFVCFIGHPWSVVVAEEGGLVLPRGSDGTVAVSLRTTPVDRELADILQVYVGPPDACCIGKTPTAGAYDLDAKTLTFDTAFDFVAGQTYTIQSHDIVVSLSSFVIGTDSDLASPEVVAIYPSGPTMPENTLRFYIQFSTPMMPHRANEFIKLLDAKGAADTAAFMSFSQELWNEERTQLTLLVDPGRIKRGAAQNAELGPALLEGRQYSIAIEDGWPSALGRQKVARFAQSFRVTQPLRSLPDVDLWRIQPPRQGSKAPLVIAFDRPFDQQQLRNAITVHDAKGARVSGTVLLGNSEQTWRLEPDASWSTPKVKIIVNTQLKDVAGNNFRDLLDSTLGTDRLIQAQRAITIDVDLGS